MTQAQVVMVDGKDLPLHCPTNSTPGWNSHPRVFLDITKTGEAKCPYTGTKARQHPLAIWGAASGYITCAVF
jgi:uncharacterized Zn-finger protein